ncbi:MAG TPA: hypothetical protein PKM88_15125 [bacterium]|nr:hypothetical protein [bacterium]
MKITIDPIWGVAAEHRGFYVTIRVLDYVTGCPIKKANGVVKEKMGLIDTGSSLSIFPRSMLHEENHTFDHPSVEKRDILTTESMGSELNLWGYKHLSVVEISTSKSSQKAIVVCQPYYIDTKWTVVSREETKGKLMLGKTQFDQDCIIGMDLLTYFDVVIVRGRQKEAMNPVCSLNGSGQFVFNSWNSAKGFVSDKFKCHRIQG